jgi:EAL domain-containing protein (putative c-di-GMP-specific phosphodiesterase class I)
MDRMKEIMRRIRTLGVKIALDDFGTGYSSLNHIREIPLDVIKVDQTFVRELVEDDYSQAFVKMVAELASTLGVSICVEGIEQYEQYKVLENMKVQFVQGYYFGRPMPKDEFIAKYISGNEKEPVSKKVRRKK